ncbi:phosphopantothenoylcysteine decarboxylase [Clostridia bacterium]|nr:phosphopantothenoylcysteine decarboxylase [Clostridia bacterium]
MEQKEIILGVTGSIAAYKAAELANNLTKENILVHVIMTAAAAEFITPMTFQTLTKNKVYVDMFEKVDYPDVRHISLAQRASLLLIAPASANTIAKLAAGIADNMLTSVTLASPKTPKILAPAMNTAMYENPVTQDNMGKLAKYGYKFIAPRASRLACGDTGRGALADVSEIIEITLSSL